MILSFTLFMPTVTSWNGKWSGEGILYARVKDLGRSKAAQEQAQKLIQEKLFIIDFQMAG